MPATIRLADARIEDIAYLAHHVFSRASDANSTALQQNAKTESTATFLTALWMNSAIFGGELLAFTLLRTAFKAVYEPRTYIPEDETKRSPPLPRDPFSWPLSIFRADVIKIKHQNGMDAYFFVRFLRMMLKIFGPIWLVSWSILLPVTGFEDGVGKTGLDRFTFGNIGTIHEGRYWAPLICAWAFTIWTWWVIYGEMHHFVTMRQEHLIDPAHSWSAQANTILITGIPLELLTVPKLTKIFSHLPGGVRKIWLNRDLKELPDIYERRLKACKLLEKYETKLISTAIKLHTRKKVLNEKERAKEDAKKAKEEAKRSRSERKTNKTSERKEKKPERSSGSESKSSTQSSDSDHSSESDRDRDWERGLPISRIEALVPRKKRPTHRLPPESFQISFPFLGKKVDSIEWARTEIETTTRLLERGRAVLRREVDERNARIGGIAGILRRKSRDKNNSGGSKKARRPSRREKKEHMVKVGKTEAKAQELEAETYPALNSAFVLFNQQIAAHLAAQALTHHEVYNMSQKYIEVAPADVIWGNLGLIPYERKVRMLISYSLTVGLIVLWSFPVAFIGAVSNVSNLCHTYTWLAWLCKLPPTVIGILEGVLPQTLLAILMALLPVVLRLLARFEGIPRKSGLELSLMTRYFYFQVIHSFLIVTISSGIIAALPGLVEDPASIPSLLASSLPQASNFFLSYIILQGLSGAAAGFLQIGPLVLYYVKLFVLGSTPRSVYKIKYTLRNVQWGTLFPATTLLAVISFAYMVISPIINGLATITFFIFFILYKYLFLYQFEQPPESDTGGLFFPRAIQQVFVGLYIQQICLAALFFLARSSNGGVSAIPEFSLTAALFVLTALFHAFINNSYNPLINPLPLSHAHNSYSTAGSFSNFSSTVTVDKRPKDVEEDSEHQTDSIVAEKHSSSSDSKSDGDDSDTKRNTQTDPKSSRHSHTSSDSDMSDDARRRGTATGKHKSDVDSKGESETTLNHSHSSSDSDASDAARRRSVGVGKAGKRVNWKGNVMSSESEMSSDQQRKSHTSEQSEEDLAGAARLLGGVYNDEPTDFYHPASVEPLRVIWLPRDDIGFADAEVAENIRSGIAASCAHAFMNGKGHVDIDGRPPGSHNDLGVWTDTGI